MQLNVDDFAPASDSEKESLSVMRESVSFWKDGLRRLRKNPIAMVSLAVLIIVLILAFIVPAFYPYDYATQIRGSENLGPMQYSEAEQAAMAAGDGAPRVYRVEPLGTLEDDPNVTDKRFPGNPTRSYRTREPVRIVEEVHGWTAPDPGVIESMKRRMAELTELGIEAMDD